MHGARSSAAALGVAAAALGGLAFGSAHPPNARKGGVTATARWASVSVTPSGSPRYVLTVSYAVPPCRTGCTSPNEDKPYALQIYLYDRRHDGVGGGSLVDGPKGCVSAFAIPAVSCDSGGRSITNPDNALPVNGSISFEVGVKPGQPPTQGEIAVQGFGSLNNYAEFAVPAAPVAPV